MKINFKYKFSELESFLNKIESVNKCLIVLNENPRATAVMHTFKVNYYGDWKSGDGILFYNDGEIHSAEPDDEFVLLKIIRL